MNFAKSIFLFSLFSCTLVELINSGLTYANELSTNASKSTSTLVDLASTSTVENPPIVKTTVSLRTEPRDTKDFHLVSISPINETLNPEVSTKKSNSSLAQAAGGINLPNQMQDKKNDIGLAVQFGNSTSFGVQGKVGVADNISIRPEVFFNSGSNAENRLTKLSDTNQPNFTTITTTNVPFTTTAPFTLPTAITLTTPVTSPVSFTNNVAIVSPDGRATLPVGTTIPAGTVGLVGQVLPAGLTLPAGVTLPGSPTTQASIGTTTIPGTNLPEGAIKSNTTGGTSFGIAITYDFKLDPQGKSTAYLGPKVAFASGSGKLTVNGVDLPDATINTNETKIGLVAGVDYAISDGFTIGANATYNFSRSLSGSLSTNGQSMSLNDFIKPAGSAIDFGIRVGYQF